MEKQIQDKAENSNMVKDPDDWTTGDEPMTGAQTGELSRGHITYPGYEHIRWEARVMSMKPETLFSFTWHPYAVDQKTDYSDEIPTLVECRLKEVLGGTLLRIIESGFDMIPANRRVEAFRMNDGGWDEQIKNIESYVDRACITG